MMTHEQDVNRWETIFLPEQPSSQGRREKCLICGSVYGARVRHWPCDKKYLDSRYNSNNGGDKMPISNEEFDGLDGTPKGGFKSDADSLTQRILRAIDAGNAYSVDEVMEMVDLKEGEDKKKVKGILNNLCRVVGKRAAKLEKKYNKDSEGFYRKVEGADEPVTEPDAVDPEPEVDIED